MKSNSVDPENLPEATNHRYRQARDYANQQRHMLQSQGDAITRELCKILKARRDGNLRGSFDANLVRALEVHESDSDLVRPQLQALLLTDMTVDEIAEDIDKSQRFVELYTRCFFDVREMPQQAKREVVAAYRDVPSERLVMDYVWKLVALAGGPSKLADVISSAEIRTVQDAAAVSAAEAKSIAQHKIAQAAKGIDVHDPDSIRELRRMLESLDDVQPNGSHEQLLEQIDGICNSLPFSVGRPDPETTPPGLMKFADSACELNVNELHRVTFGQELENEDEILSMRFPEGPDDHAALSIPQIPREDPPNVAEAQLAASESTTTAGTSDAPVPPPHAAVARASELKFKHARVKKEKEKTEQQQAARVEAARQAAQEAERQQRMANEAYLNQLDKEWEAFAGDSVGAQRHRKWLRFRKRYPNYFLKKSREQLAKFEKKS